MKKFPGMQGSRKTLPLTKRKINRNRYKLIKMMELTEKDPKQLL